LFVNVMNDEQPSRTAMTAAAARAAHLIVDDAPVIFADTVARAILGAGLDSYGYRQPLPGGPRVFEVDPPATQRWKRHLLSAAGIDIPPTVTYVPVDFETDNLADCLVHSGFDPALPTLVSWLGVTMYLTEQAIADTLAIVGGFARGTEIVLDHMLPPHLREAAGNTYVDLVAPVAAKGGEPWLTFLGPDEMSVLLKESGFTTVENVSQRDAVDATLWHRTDSLRPARLSHLAHATR
jgi:methyltransferase (TIGR00027 family)